MLPLGDVRFNVSDVRFNVSVQSNCVDCLKSAYYCILKFNNIYVSCMSRKCCNIKH